MLFFNGFNTLFSVCQNIQIICIIYVIQQLKFFLCKLLFVTIILSLKIYIFILLFYYYLYVFVIHTYACMNIQVCMYY